MWWMKKQWKSDWDTKAHIITVENAPAVMMRRSGDGKSKEVLEQDD